MTEHYTPIAMIELDRNGQLLALNPIAQKLFNLADKTTLHHINLKQLINVDLLDNDIADKIVIINQQHYFIQKVFAKEKIILFLQPLAYLKKCLSKQTIINQQAFDLFLAESEVMQKLIQQAKVYALQREPLLISGETGTGKDLLAQACHQYSQRGDQIFLALNCAAMPDEVVESELYGHAPGAYLGAIEGKKGFFEQASGGSVLLDGIDEMSFRMQTKLIRFINTGAFRRVGDDNEVSVDVRIICATKVDLLPLVKKGLFREDLYYRLNVLPLHIPSLKERKTDIMPLTYSFVNEFANKQAIPMPDITDEVKSLLINYDWPGNIRELKNILYSAMVQLTSTTLRSKDIQLPNIQQVLAKTESIYSLENIEDKSLDEMTKQFEKRILSSLYTTYPSSRKLSKRLGISHTAIANKLREYGIGK